MEKVKRTKVVDLLKSTAYGSIVNVKGWVRTHRSSKAVDFIALNDGSTINNIQIVVDPSKVDENQLRQITTGACISAVGTLVESQGAGQSVEIQCESIEIHSGKNRIVRRIFESLGYRVTKLDRVQFAGLTKKNLRRGDWRFLTEKEVDMLRMGAFE